MEVIEDFIFENATRDRTCKNITKTLRHALGNKGTKENLEKILKIHGIHPDNFDAVKMMSKFISGKLNDLSIDGNANKTGKTISMVSGETSAPKDKAVGYDFLYQEMKRLYGKEEAKRLSGEMYTYALALSDSSQILKNYCYSVDLSFLITEGRQFGQLPSAPCKSIRSYIGCACETLHQLSNHLAGACAASSLFFDISHLCLYHHKLDIRELKTNKWFRKEIENTFQHFVHSMNMLSRSSSQSPFTNVSINDSIKVKKVVLEMAHMFPYNELPINKPTGLLTKEEEEEFYLNYIVDYILDIQDVYVDFFSKGASTLNGAPFRFPVSTQCLSKHRNRKTCQWEPSDKKFLKNICKKEIERFNIFTSEGTKFASCCFDGHQEIPIRLENDVLNIKLSDIYKKTRYTEEEMTVNNLTEKEIKDGKLITAFNNGEGITANVICLDYDDVMYHIELADGTILKATKDHLHVVRFNEDFCIDVKSEHLFVGNTLLMKDNKFVEVVDIEMKWHTGKVYCLKTTHEEARFDLTSGVITHNCRLINDAELMSDYAAQSNSFGAGGSISLGAHRVLTINFPRLVFEVNTERDFWKLFDKRIEDSAKILKAHKSLLWRLTEAGLQEFISMGIIRFDRLFSTFGMLGIHECEELYLKKFNVKDKMINMCQFFNSKVHEYSHKYDIAGNIEQIPGESMASRLASVDKLLFPEQAVYDMYSNQPWPLWKEATVWERLEKDGMVNSYLTGGGISHATLGEKLTPKQNEQIIMYSIASGCEHFALNPFFSKCCDKHINRGKLSKCPDCGADIIDYITRIIGYFISVSDADSKRGKEIMSRPDTSFE